MQVLKSYVKMFFNPFSKQWEQTKFFELVSNVIKRDLLSYFLRGMREGEIRDRETG